jgi:hypothetical protein
MFFEGNLMATITSFVVSVCLIAFSIFCALLDWTEKLNKYPRLKKLGEARIPRTILLFSALGLLAVVLHDLNEVLDKMNAPPLHQPAPAPINLKELAPFTAAQIAKPSHPGNSGISSSTIAGHDNAVAGSVNQSGRNNIAQTGPNSSATINEVPPERRIKPDVVTSAGPVLAASRARVNVIVMAGDNEAQQLGVDIYNLLKNSGWTMENQIVVSAMKVGGPFEPGVVIYRHGEPVTTETTVSLPAGHPLLALRAFFEKAQLKYTAQQRMGTPEGVIDIEVGPSPKE